MDFIINPDNNQNEWEEEDIGIFYTLPLSCPTTKEDMSIFCNVSWRGSHLLTKYLLSPPSPNHLAVQGWGLLSQFSPFRYFPHFLLLSKQTLAIEYHVYIWQVLPQLSCGNTCQIWMWFRESNRYFCKIENFAYGEISERSFSNPHPCTVSMGLWDICHSATLHNPVRHEVLRLFASLCYDTLLNRWFQLNHLRP